MASELRITTLANNAGTEKVDTTYVVNGSAKAWLAFATDSSQSITGDTFNVSSYSDTGTGTSLITVVNAFNNALYPVQNTATSNYPYHGKAATASTFQLRTVDHTGNSADGAKNAVAHGDLA